MAISFASWRSTVYRVTVRAGRAAISFASYRYVIMGFTALAVLAPLSLLLYQSFLTVPFYASKVQAGLNAYHFVFADEDFAIAFGTTLLLGASMTLIAVPLGAMLAFLMVRTDIPGRLWLEPMILLLIFLPPVVLAFGYVAALGPAGILPRLCDRAGQARALLRGVSGGCTVDFLIPVHFPHLRTARPFTGPSLRGNTSPFGPAIVCLHTETCAERRPRRLSSQNCPQLPAAGERHGMNPTL